MLQALTLAPVLHNGSWTAVLMLLESWMQGCKFKMKKKALMRLCRFPSDRCNEWRSLHGHQYANRCVQLSG